VKRLIVLLVLVAGGVVAAAFVIPTNAASVNGAAISQSQLNANVRAVADSPDYQCFLNADAYVSSQGSAEAPPVTGAGTGQNAGDNPTATSVFASESLQQEIQQEAIAQLAAQRHVVVTDAQVAAANKVYEEQISQVMAEVAQSAQGENPRFTCGAVGKPLTGSEILSTMPSSFVDQQVQYVATATALAEDFSGYGSSAAGQLRYYQSHLAAFDTVCYSVAGFTSQSAATAAKAQVDAGTPFSTVAAATQGGGPQGCAVLYALNQDLPSNVRLGSLSLNAVSDPVAVNGNYFLIQVTKRTHTAFSGVKSLLSNAIQQAGATKAQAALAATTRHADVNVNPQYGVWVSVPGRILVPLSPAPSDVPNAKANEPATSSSASPSSASASPFSG
jgi:PPIC-type PPIASE domain